MIDINNFAAEISSGYSKNLFKRIGEITITDIRIRDAFKTFVKNVECDESLAVIDIISSGEAILNKRKIDDNAGNELFVFDNMPNTTQKLKKLLDQNSVGGLSALYTLDNGMIIDLNMLGGSIASAETKRYLIASPKKSKKILALAEKDALKLLPIGRLITDSKVHFCDRENVIASIDKKDLVSSEPVSIKLGTEHFQDFLNGYKSMSTYAFSNLISKNNFLNFGLDISIESLFSRAMGIFLGMMHYQVSDAKIIYSNNSGISVAVPKPKVCDGDYFYLLRVRNDETQMPDRNHSAQLCHYLKEKAHFGIIKDVLPLRENIEKILEHLGNDSVEYIRLNSVPENSFGLIVSVPRGESVNGIKLGYFKDKE